MVEINAGDRKDGGVVEGGCTVNSGVVTNIGSYPVGCLVAGIRQNGLLPSLQGYVSVSETVILENKGRVYAHILSSVAKLVYVVEKMAWVGERERGGIGTECSEEEGNEGEYEIGGVCFFLLHLT